MLFIIFFKKSLRAAGWETESPKPKKHGYNHWTTITKMITITKQKKKTLMKIVLFCCGHSAWQQPTASKVQWIHKVMCLVHCAVMYSLKRTQRTVYTREQRHGTKAGN